MLSRNNHCPAALVINDLFVLHIKDKYGHTGGPRVLAKKIGMSRQAVYRILRGTCRISHRAKIEHILKTIGPDFLTNKQIKDYFRLREKHRLKRHRLECKRSYTKRKEKIIEYQKEYRKTPKGRKVVNKCKTARKSPKKLEDKSLYDAHRRYGKEIGDIRFVNNKINKLIKKRGKK